MRYKCTLLFIVILCLMAFSQSLRIITENAPPNSFIENDTLTGRAVEVVKAVLKEIGMEFTIELFPWARGYQLLQSDEPVALFGTSRTKLREKQFKWAGPISSNSVKIYKLSRRRDVQPEELSDYNNYKIGSGRNDQKTQYLQEHGIKVDIVNEDWQNIEKLFLGRIDVMAYSENRLNYDITKLGYDPEQITAIEEIEEISTDIYIAFSLSTDDALVEKIQTGFDVIRDNGILKEILSRWE